MSESTKEKIKKIALTLFAQKGYDGTAMKDIAQLVGIKTPSLYAHFKGKEDLFFSIYEDLANEYVDLMDQIINTADQMDVEESLFYIFEQYIIYYMRNPDIQAFWNQIILFTPSELKERFYSHVVECDSRIQKKMEEIFEKAIKQGRLRDDCPKKMSWSFRVMREGILNWMMMFPKLRREELIKAFWTDLWLGLKKQ